MSLGVVRMGEMGGVGDRFIWRVLLLFGICLLFRVRVSFVLGVGRLEGVV